MPEPDLRGYPSPRNVNPTYGRKGVVLNDGGFEWDVAIEQLTRENTEGRYTDAELKFEALSRAIQAIQTSGGTPQEQAQAVAAVLQKSGFSVDAVAQVTGVDKAEIESALTQAGFDGRGNPVTPASQNTPSGSSSSIIPSVIGAVAANVGSSNVLSGGAPAGNPTNVLSPKSAPTPVPGTNVLSPTTSNVGQSNVGPVVPGPASAVDTGGISDPNPTGSGPSGGVNAGSNNDALLGILASAGAGLLGVYLNNRSLTDASESATTATLDAIDRQGAINKETLDTVLTFIGDQTDQNREDLEPWRNIGGDALDSIREGYESGDLVTPRYQAFQQNNFDPRAYDDQFNPEGYVDKPFEGEYERDPFDFEEDPGYQFRKSEGQKAISRSASAGGFLKSGAYDKGINRFTQDLASQEYGNAFDRYLSEEGLDYRDFVTGYDIDRGNEADRFRTFAFNQDVERQDDITDYNRFTYTEDKRREDFYNNRNLAYQDWTNQYNADLTFSNNEFNRRFDVAQIGLSATGTGVNAGTATTRAATGAVNQFGVTAGDLAGSTGTVNAQNYINQGNVNPWSDYATVVNRGISNYLIR